MKNLRFILAFLSVVAVAGELQYEPATPMRGKSMLFTYTADPEYFSEPDSLWLVVYVFDDKRLYPTAYDVRLSRTKGSTYQGRLDTIPQEAVFLLFRIHSGRETDDNRGRMWDAIVHDKGKPVWGSYYRAALSYLGNGGVSSITRRPDLNRAYEFLRQSLETHPEHLAAKFAYAGVRFDRKEIQQADLNQTFERLLALPWDSTNEMQVRSRSRALRVLGRTDDAENLEQWFAKKYHTSDLAEEVERNYCAAARTPEEFRDRIRSYAQRYPWSPMAVKMYADLVNYYLQQGNGDAALQTVNSYPFPSGVTTAPPAFLLNMVAVAFVRQDSLLRLAQQYIEWAIRSFEAVSVDDRARFISPSEFRWQQREMVGICYDTWGYVLYRLGRLEEAIDAFQTCERILGPFASGDMLEHQSEALMAAGRRRESLDVARRAIATGRAISQTVMRFLQSSTDTATINAEYRALRQQARSAKLRRLRQEMLNQPVLDLQLRRNDGSTFFLRDVVLTTLDGRKIKLGDLKGKVVVLDFWATWCGPCRISMPYMQQLYEKYQGNKDVEILLVNCWERVDDRVAHVKKYLANNSNFTFPVVLDLRDEAVAGFGVTGIPTKFYLDRNGVVQFKEVGFPGAEVFVEESSDRIEVLLRQ